MSNTRLTRGDMSVIRPAEAYLRLVPQPETPGALAGHAALMMIDNFDNKGDFSPQDPFGGGDGYSLSDRVAKGRASGFSFGMKDGRAAFSPGYAMPVTGVLDAALRSVFPKSHDLFRSTTFDSDGEFFHHGMTASSALRHPYVGAMIGLGSKDNAAKARLEVRMAALSLVGAPALEGPELELFSYSCGSNLPGIRSEMDHIIGWINGIVPEERKPDTPAKVAAALFCSLDEFNEDTRDRDMAPQRRLAFIAAHPDMLHFFGPTEPTDKAGQEIRSIVDGFPAMDAEMVGAAIADAIGQDLWTQIKEDPLGYSLSHDFEPDDDEAPGYY